MSDLAPLQTTKHSRYETLDGMRGIAAICVMIFHYVKDGKHPFLNNSSLAVDLFFMLSGFVIAHSYGKRLVSGMTASAYLAKRFIRLYPMYVLGLGLGVIALALMQQAGLTNGTSIAIAQSFAFNLFYLPTLNYFNVHNLGSSIAVRGIFPGNPPSWSLFFEVIASAAFLVLAKFPRRALLLTVAGSFILFVVCGLLPNSLHQRFELDLDQGWSAANFIGGFPRVIYSFTFGLLLYSFASDDASISLRATLKRILRHPFTLYALLVLVFFFPVSLRGLYSAFILACVAPFLVFAGSVVHSDGATSLAVTRFLGWISYPIYCLHFPIGNLVFLLVVTKAHLPAKFAVAGSIVATLVGATLLTKFIEEPVRAWLTKLNSTPRVSRGEV